MKKKYLKITSALALIASISLTSCDNVSSNLNVETKKEDVLRITTPQPSPLGSVSQRVGLTDVTI